MDASTSEKEVKRIDCKHGGALVAVKEPGRSISGSPANYQRKRGKRPRCDPPAGFQISNNCLIFPLSNPNFEDYCSTAATVFGGTARQALTGPSIGLVDIGVGKSAYFFQVALPGVKKDPGTFSCEVERDGKINISGVTTNGEKRVSRGSRVFKMKFQQQCPPGPFTVSFSLP